MKEGSSLWRIYIVVSAVTGQKWLSWLQYEFYPKSLSSRPQYIRWPRGLELYVYLLSLFMLLFSYLLVYVFVSLLSSVNVINNRDETCFRPRAIWVPELQWNQEDSDFVKWQLVHWDCCIIFWCLMKRSYKLLIS